MSHHNLCLPRVHGTSKNNQTLPNKSERLEKIMTKKSHKVIHSLFLSYIRSLIIFKFECSTHAPHSLYPRPHSLPRPVHILSLPAGLMAAIMAVLLFPPRLSYIFLSVSLLLRIRATPPQTWYNLPTLSHSPQSLFLQIAVFIETKEYSSRKTYFQQICEC